jgi:hypothetical protein
VKVKQFFAEPIPGIRRCGGAGHCRAASAVRRLGQMTTFWPNQPGEGAMEGRHAPFRNVPVV